MIYFKEYTVMTYFVSVTERMIKICVFIFDFNIYNTI